uniref:J domain-containing protein n=1 Tax=viral metagenome TaxID=1070528 RepID=A0A6C0KZD8_9ZZZZ|tara:strand:- start:4813 stop:5757 length:945 start_codon:yes stop_codon:yes gene_type:complete
MSYYDILKINTKATDAEIKKAYRQMSFVKHPDKNPNCREEYLKINEAYETLKDKDKRRMYDFTNCDASIIDGDVGSMNMDFNDFFSEMLSSAIDKGKKKGKGKKINEFATLFGMPGIDENIQFDPTLFMNSNPIDMFNQLPEDILIEQIITYHQSYNGCYIPIGVEREIKKGNMRKTESETIYINVDKGADNNEIINIIGKGNIKEGVASDIKVKIILESHREYSRRGIDLVLHKSITFKESLCGFQFNIEHINGKSIKFTSSRGNVIQNGDEKTIDSLGFHRNEQIGNLILSFKVEHPDTLNEEELKTIEEVF